MKNNQFFLTDDGQGIEVPSTVNCASLNGHFPALTIFG